MNLHTNPVPSIDLPNSEEDGAQDNVYITCHKIHTINKVCEFQYFYHKPFMNRHGVMIISSMMS